MTHRLDGVRAKIDRAKENIINLEREQRAFLTEHYRKDLIGEFHPNEWEYVCAVPGDLEPVPPRFAVLVGEVLYLLRSSLDHLLGQLVRLSKPNHPLNGVQFPICTDPRKHRTSQCGKIQGIPDDAAAAIVALQPCFRRTGPWLDHPLAILNNLNNRDKHRLLVVLAAAVTDITKHDVQVTARDLRGYGVQVRRRVVLGSQKPTPVSRVLFSPGPNCHIADVKMKCRLVFDVSLQEPGAREGGSLIPFLQQLFDFTDRTIRKFDRFF
jgi:hypothetical protein